MGYLTEVILHIDALTAFKEDPKRFGEAVISAILLADRKRGQVSVPFKQYCNYISAEPCRHADHHALFLSKGNRVSVIGKHEDDWENLIKTNPVLAKEQIQAAESVLKMAKGLLKNKKEKNR